MSVWVCKGYSGAQAVTAGLVWGFKLILGKARKAKLARLGSRKQCKERKTTI